MNELRTSFRRLGDTLLALLQTRLALFNVELQQGALAAFDALVYAVAALVLMLFGIGCGLALLWTLCPPDWRPWAMGAAALLLLGTGLALLRQGRARLAQAGGVFKGTLAELAADREALGPQE